MELNFALICESATLDERNRLTILNVFDEIKTDKNEIGIIPYVISVVTNYSVEQGVVHVQKLLVKNDGGDILKEEITENSNKEKPKIGFLGKLTINFPDYGNYKVELYLDGNFMKSIDFRISPKSND